MTSGGLPGGFSGDPAVSSSRLIAFLDACRKVDLIAEGKKWSLERLELAPGESVLDAGCGTGEDVVALAALVMPGGHAVGMDVSEAMIEEASRRHHGTEGASFVVGEAEQLPFDSASFDACRAERLLQHVHDPDLAAREIARVLRVGGRVALIDPDWGGFLIEGANPELSSVIWRNHVAGARQPYIGRRLRSLLMQCGFVEISMDVAVGVISDFDRASQIFDFELAAAEAVDAEVVASTEAAGWLQELEQAARRGQFFCAIPSFRVAGRKR